MPEVTSDPVDDELRRIAEALTAEAPAAPPFAALRATGAPSTRRPWRAAVAVAAAAVALVAGVVAVVRLPAEEGADKAVTVPSLPRDPSDRLILGDVEWLPDGTVRRLGFVGDDEPAGGLGYVRATPDGGAVAVRPLPPPDPIPDGFDEFSDMRFSLLVVDAAGELVVDRVVDFRVASGVTDTDVLFVEQPRAEGTGRDAGPATVMAQELVSGDERELYTFPAADVDQDRDWDGLSAAAGDTFITVEASVLEADVVGNVSTLVAGSQACRMTVVDLATGDRAEHELAIPCEFVNQVQPSADGSQVAIGYQPVDDPSVAGKPGFRVGVADTATGAVTFDRAVGDEVEVEGGRSSMLYGLAWDGQGALRALLHRYSAAGQAVASPPTAGFDPAAFEVVRIPLA